MIIFEYKSPRSIIFWLIIISLFSIIGFMLYIIFGNRLKFKAKKQLINYKKSTKNYLKYTNWYSNYKQNNLEKINNKQIKIISYLKNNFNIKLWHNNKIKIYNNGQLFLSDLIKDLKSAKSTINIEFYIFADDNTGKTISSILTNKAKQGIVVNVIYDAIGSKKTKKKFWENLKSAGVNVFPFFPSKIFTYLNFRINYRNHRKIVVIDGKISYLGGVNLRDDHMGKDKKLLPWRDTQIKIIGNATYAVQNIFLNDWSFVCNKKIGKEFINVFFPAPYYKNGNSIQILASGPENNNNIIMESYIKIIEQTGEFLYIQTPYFIVKKDILKKIIDAKNRGTDVRIFIPKKPDKKLVYAGTLHCIKDLLKWNIQIYLYKGFIHSKTLSTENVLSVGSVNFDNRSFELNFESTAFIYDKRIIQKHKNMVIQDIQNSTLLTEKIYNKISTKNFIFKILYKLFYKIM